MTRTSAPLGSSSMDNHKNGLFAEKVMITKADLYRAGWASSLGSALEYYDFALYSLASALIFGPLFFPAQDPAIGLIASFGTYFIGFAVRPVGGIIFGILGDRLRRQHANWCTPDLRQRRLLGSCHACQPTPAPRVWGRRGAGRSCRADDRICAARAARLLRRPPLHGHPIGHRRCISDLFHRAATNSGRCPNVVVASPIPTQRRHYRRCDLDSAETQGIA